MTTTVATLNAVISADSTGFVRALDAAKSSMNGLDNGSKTLKESMKQVGATMTAAVTLPLLAIGAASVKAASGFDASMHNINSIAHMTGTELDALAKKTLDFGSTTRSGPQAVAGALYEVYSAGIMGDKAFEIMAVSSKTAEAGLADLTSTTNALTATVMAYSNQNLSAADASNVWTKMVQLGVGSLDDFLANSQKVLPLGSALGISFQDLGANIAYISQQGGGAKKAMTAVAMAMSNILKPTKAMSAAFATLGVHSGVELIKKFGSFEGAVLALHKAVKDPVEFNKMFSKTGLEAVLTMTNNVDALNKSIADFGVGLGDATQSAWDEQMKSYAAQSAHFNSALETISITIGQQLLPILTPLLEAGTKFILNLAKTNPELIKLAVGFGLVLAAVGPVLLIISMLMNPIGLLLAGVGALAVAFATDFGGIRTTVTNVISAIMVLIDPLITGIKALYEIVSGTGVTFDQASALDGFVTSMNDVLGKIQGKATDVGSKPIDIKVPVKAGMTLYDIYYNSDQSKELQGVMSYDDFLAKAKEQIKGGDPRWLQAGSTLSFSVPVTAGVDVKPVTLKTGIDWGFQGVKAKIQEQYDFVFKGKPLVDDNGVDLSANLPVLRTLKDVVDNVKIVVSTWADAFSVTLANIRDGISGFFDGFKGKDYSGLVNVFSTAVGLVSNFSTIVSIISSKILIFAGDLLKGVLPRLGTLVADFIQTMSNIASGNFSVGNLDQLILDIANIFGTIADKILGGNGFDAATGLTALAGGIRNALLVLVSAFENGFRDLKLKINQGVLDVLKSLDSAMSALHDAKLVSDNAFDNFRITIRSLQVDTDATGFAKALETGLLMGISNVGNIMVDGKDLQTQISMGNAKQIADNMTIQGKANLLQAIQTAIANGDKDNVLAVDLPIAIAGGIDLSKLNLANAGTTLKDKIMSILQGTTANVDGSVGIGLDYTATGKQIIDGLNKGIDDNKVTVVNTVTKMGDDTIAALNSAWGIKSPSKVAQGIAGFLVAGLIMGMALGTLGLIIASNLMALIGVKIPVQNTLSSAEGNRIVSSFVQGMIDALRNPELQNAANGVVGVMDMMKTGVIAIGNDLVSQMDKIVQKVANQLTTLKKAIADAGNLKVPTGTSVPTKGVTEGGGNPTVPTKTAIMGAVTQGLISNDVVNSVANSSIASNTSTQSNTVVVNGVQDVDKMLFELKRRGIKLA